MFHLRVNRIDIRGECPPQGLPERSVVPLPVHQKGEWPIVFAAAGIVDGVVGEGEEAQVG